MCLAPLINMSIGKKVKLLRKQKRWTTRDLAFRVSLTQGYISQVENNISGIGFANLLKLADAFEVSPVIFFSDGIKSVEHAKLLSDVFQKVSELPEPKLELLHAFIVGFS